MGILFFLIYDMNTINKHDYNEDLVWIGFLITDEKGIGIRFTKKNLPTNPYIPISLMREINIFELMEEVEKHNFTMIAEVCASWIINGWKKTKIEIDEVDKLIFLQFILEIEKKEGIFYKERRKESISFIKKYLRNFFK